MSKEGKRPYQLHLDEQVPETIYEFFAGTVIYPERSSRGVLTRSIHARRTNGKIKGLTGYQALTRIDLYLNGRYWSLPEGTLFGAYSKKAHKRKIK